jgi:hypothetical protein
MFGKISSILYYFKVFDVYIVKRFPTNKLPLAGLIATYFSTYLLIRIYFRDGLLNFPNTKALFIKKKEINTGKWQFN